MTRPLPLCKQNSEATPETLSNKKIHLILEELYRSIPATTCSNCGSCCRITSAERRQGWVTMYPLYAVEYLHIAAHVGRDFPPAKRDYFLNFREEWPLQCPFLDQEKAACTIYPVRPLTCRTYGIMNEPRMEEALGAHKNHLPPAQLERFRRLEKHHRCPDVQVAETDKLNDYAARRIESWYTKQLEILSVEAPLMDRAKRQVFETITERPGILSWTWGGFNALRVSSMEAFITQFPDYWMKAELAR
jgi:Fe-S-cluster containining protein